MGGVPSKPDPSKSIQLISASMSRTGTNSMQLALEILLDGPVLHGGTMMISGSDDVCKTWLEAVRAHRNGDRERALKYTRKATAGYVSVVDVPGILVLDEQLELYPDAKVLIVTRDPEKWWPSLRPIVENSMNVFHQILMGIYPGIRYFPQHVEELKRFFDAENALVGKPPGVWGPWVIESWTKRTIERIPKERLLVMNLSQGWEPLCKFLNKPIPNVPFPHVNDSDEADRTAKRVVRKLLLCWLGAFTVTGVGIYGGYKLWSMQ